MHKILTKRFFDILKNVNLLRLAVYRNGNVMRKEPEIVGYTFDKSGIFAILKVSRTTVLVLRF